jgi:hypothetical protein
MVSKRNLDNLDDHDHDHDDSRNQDSKELEGLSDAEKKGEEGELSRVQFGRQLFKVRQRLSRSVEAS